MFERGLNVKNALIALGAGLLFVAGLAIIVYVTIARDRIGPATPTPRPPTRAASATLAVRTATPKSTTTKVKLDTVTGVVREYSPGALIIVLTPTDGQAEQVIVQENIAVSWQNGERASPREVATGQTIYAEGALDALGRLVAQRLVILKTGPTATATVWSTPTTPAASSAVPLQAWLGEYWANKALTGSPALTRRDAAIAFQWGEGAPAAELPTDGFSVRWRGRWPLEKGRYVFNAQSDDGARVWVDGKLVIDQWRDQALTLATGEIELTTGEHLIQVEYYENSSGAEVRVWWEQKGAYMNWKGEYFPNARLEGLPIVTRDDAQVSFDWGLGAPAAQVPEDHFSARWTRTIQVEEGAYRFKARADDGVRVWVDERPLIDAWTIGDTATQEGYIWLDNAAHQVRVEYYDEGGQASVHVWWERIGAFAGWRGEYFANPNLTQPPTLVRDDAQVFFDFGLGAPAYGMPIDGFSARWTRRMTFTAGTYLFWALADDGIRLYVDGKTVIDAWHDGAVTRSEGQATLTKGEHEIVVEYYERSGDAYIQAAWEAKGATATLTASPTATTAPTATVTLAPPTATATATATQEPPTPTWTPSPTATEQPTPTYTPEATPSGPITGTMPSLPTN